MEYNQWECLDASSSNQEAHIETLETKHQAIEDRRPCLNRKVGVRLSLAIVDTHRQTVSRQDHQDLGYSLGILLRLCQNPLVESPEIPKEEQEN